jgi:hypothetical protein
VQQLAGESTPESILSAIAGVRSTFAAADAMKATMLAKLETAVRSTLLKQNSK